MRHPNGTITATAARKLARLLGPAHPAVVRWRDIARGRVARINRADASHRRLAAPPVASLEHAKEGLAAAALALGLSLDRGQA